MRAPAAVDWSAIDTVLVDMDGTLLDLAFDNWFWQELIPRRYASLHGLGADESRAVLQPKFRAAAGSLDWYCIDHWSRELGLDIGAIKRAARGELRFLPGAEQFLMSLRERGKRAVLITNAHPETLAIKNERLALLRHVDASYSAHPFRAPKEHRQFWQRLRRAEPFAPSRTLFIDDSLPVLEVARSFGIAWLRAVRRPDSSLPPRDSPDFAAIDRVVDLL
ncbi:MAG TPA: GMP/IMP nucleotidase [Steroidobacteraceae bacterium]|nr:GMP/IMP nucleotidase [Steroidobacteraceae bacterium]